MTTPILIAPLYTAATVSAALGTAAELVTNFNYKGLILLSSVVSCVAIAALGQVVGFPMVIGAVIGALIGVANSQHPTLMERIKCAVAGTLVGGTVGYGFACLPPLNFLVVL
jgi:hypothetical protein